MALGPFSEWQNQMELVQEKLPGIWHAAGLGGGRRGGWAPPRTDGPGADGLEPRSWPTPSSGGAVRSNQVRTQEPVWPWRGRGGGSKAGTGPCAHHPSAHAPDICSETAPASPQSAGGTEEAPGLPEFTAAQRGDLPRSSSSQGPCRNWG